MDEGEEARLESLPVADTHAPGLEGSPFVTQQFPVRHPADYRNEFLVQVRASSLREARVRLEELSSQGLPWREAALGFSMLAAGAALSAWASGVRIDTAKGALFFVLMPVISSASFVAYMFLRKLDGFDRNRLKDVVSYLPDPDDTSEMSLGE